MTSLIFQLEAEKIELEDVTFNPRVLCDDVVMLFAAVAADKGIDVAVFAEPRVPELLFADEGRLRQIITNLVSNAIKFTAEGSITISIDLEDEQLSILVRDSGRGIAPQHFEHIFRPALNRLPSLTAVPLLVVPAWV